MTVSLSNGLIARDQLRRLAPLVSDGVDHLPAFSGGRADPLSLVQQQQEKEREEVDYTSI